MRRTSSLFPRWTAENRLSLNRATFLAGEIPSVPLIAIREDILIEVMDDFRGWRNHRASGIRGTAMSDKERDYFRRRAEQELELAKAAATPEAARAHSMLAGCYLNRVGGADDIASIAVTPEVAA